MQIICTLLYIEPRQYVNTQFLQLDALPAAQLTASKHWRLWTSLPKKLQMDFQQKFWNGDDQIVEGEVI